MKVLVSGRGRTEGEVVLDEVLEKSDVVSLHISGTEENRNFLNKGRIDRIKVGAVLINTTKGARRGLCRPGKRPQIREALRLGIGRLP